MTKIWLYKEYNDSDAYGEELTAVYEDREDAIAHLAERFETCTGMTMHEYNAEHQKNDLNTVDPDYVCFDTGDGYWFGVVEEKMIIPPLQRSRKYLEKVNEITGNDFGIDFEYYKDVFTLTLNGRRIKTLYCANVVIEESKKVLEEGLPFTEESCYYLKVKDLVKDYISGKLEPEEV